MMRVEKLELTNFRGLSRLSLEFASRTTVLVGTNGVGKTAILDAMAVLLSRLVPDVLGRESVARSFSPLDIENGRDSLECDISVRMGQQVAGWGVGVSRMRSQGRNEEQLQQARESVIRALEGNSQASVPLMVFYPTNRAVLDIPLRIRTPHNFDQLDAYDDALTGGESNFRLFFEWFRDREDLENESRLTSPEYRDPHLQAVRQAIERVTVFRDLRVRRQPLRMTLEKQGEELVVNQLSDGEKCLLALAADLARRLAIANPALSNPLEGEGLVLIDEIELHLHPAWQRMIIPRLEEAFPHCQFIVSTHSPQVISEVRPEGVVLLERRPGEGIIALHASASYGRDSNRILEDLMDVPERPGRIKEKLREYFRLIDTNALEEARRMRQELEQEIGRDEPEFARADVLMRRKELLNRETHRQGR
jgi:predicted ATP-binding protein involved in virulence